MKRKIVLILIVLFYSNIITAKIPGKKRKKVSPEILLLKKEISRLRLKRQKLQLENSIANEKFKKKIKRLKEKTRLHQLKNQKMRQLILEQTQQYNFDSKRINSKIARMRLKTTKMRLKNSEYKADLDKLRTDIIRRKQKKLWDSYVNKKMHYTTHPFRQGRLVISDRRVTLNGPIYYSMAEHIVRKIHFFNNKSKKYPIFLIIDSSPGGSVMAGYRIQRAMKASKAPIYVVVKSYAASMAAVIATSAKRSYAFPSAIILHHQVSSYNRGNITQQKEKLKIVKEWMKRIATPVARKMGISLKKFIVLMYKNNSNGNWREFGDRAVKLKWINRLVYEISEKSITTIRKKRIIKRFRIFSEKIDGHGKKYIELPRLNYYDVHYLYNPDGYYKY